ncbi:MAG: ATP synthase F1 subunit gamma [Bacteroidales bacterium]|nr:ATP synthase F1 subunit gamma [Bacteroidales bacterium]
MANLKEVRTRIASVSSTQQITSAMKMVSAAKFRRAQMAILGMRPYAAQLESIIASINVDDGVTTPFHFERSEKHVLLIVVTSNKGLCGGFNANVIKQASARVDYYRQQQCPHLSLITIGKKATEVFSKQEGLVEESHDELLDNATFDQVHALSDLIMQRFVQRQYDKVEVIYNQFKNSITQVLTTEQFLPIQPTRLPQSQSAKSSVNNDFIYEPNKQEILRNLVPFMLHTQFYRIILDSLAAEHGARMSAMQSATDNANELLKELRLTYNKARQAAITNEIIEIVSGSEALKG